MIFRNKVSEALRLLLCLTILLLTYSSVYSQQQDRSELRPSEALVGRWALYIKSWIGFGDWKRGETIAEFRPNGRLIYYEKNGPTNLVYSILNQDDTNGTIELFVQKPSTGGSHTQYIQFSHDRNMFYEQTSFTKKNIRTRRDKTVTIESKHVYLGPPN